MQNQKNCLKPIMNSSILFKTLHRMQSYGERTRFFFEKKGCNWKKKSPFNFEINSSFKTKLKASNESIYSPLNQFKIPNFLNIQRSSFREFLKKGLIAEFQKYNSIHNSTQTLEVFFYAEHYKLNRPKWTPKQAILKKKSYSCQFYLPVQLSNYQTEEVHLQWVLLANLPLMTKNGHFILNGCPRVLMNQIVRSPGVYFRKGTKNQKIVYSADFIAQRGSWLRLEVDTKKGDIWAKLKKTPKIPIFTFLRALGLTLPILNNSIDFGKLRYLLQFKEETKRSKKIKDFLGPGINNSLDISDFRALLKNLKKYMKPKPPKRHSKKSTLTSGKSSGKKKLKKWLTPFVCTTYFQSLLELCQKLSPQKKFLELDPKFSQKFLFRKFQNPRTYDLSVLGRSKINKKLGLSIPLENTILTSQDVLFACLFLMDLMQGLVISDDIDDLKNRKMKPSGELIQTQLSTGLVRLEKRIREKLKQRNQDSEWVSNLFTVKPLNQAFRDFFGTNPLSQLMDQTNALSEITHKRRLSSLGPGGINRETAGMAIRGIHPTHYGRICPIETPEGQNAGLVNSFTILSHLNTQNFIETPFYKMYKGFILKNKNPFLFSSDQERNLVLAPGDIKNSVFHFLPSGVPIPSRQFKEFKRVSRNEIHFIAVSPIQMISIATSLIPFLEHNDGNRALMGSNMQRQAVPTLRPSKPIVGTGLESRVISDVGHALQVQKSGFVSYVDGKKIIIYSKKLKSQNLFFEPIKSNLKKKKSLFFNLDLEQKTLYDMQSFVTPRSSFKKKLVKTAKVFNSKSAFSREKRTESLVRQAVGLHSQTAANAAARIAKRKQLNSVLHSTKPFNLSGKRRLDLVINKTLFRPNSFKKRNESNFVNPDKLLDTNLYSDFSILPFQLKIKENDFNNKQLACLSNSLFLNDFLGQFELLKLFSKNGPYSKLTKNFKPFFSKRSLFLINRFSHQKLLFSYCKIILIHFYNKLNKIKTQKSRRNPKFPSKFLKRKFLINFSTKPEKNFQKIDISRKIQILNSLLSNSFSLPQSTNERDSILGKFSSLTPVALHSMQSFLFRHSGFPIGVVLHRMKSFEYSPAALNAMQSFILRPKNNKTTKKLAISKKPFLFWSLTRIFDSLQPFSQNVNSAVRERQPSNFKNDNLKTKFQIVYHKNKLNSFQNLSFMQSWSNNKNFFLPLLSREVKFPFSFNPLFFQVFSPAVRKLCSLRGKMDFVQNAPFTKKPFKVIGTNLISQVLKQNSKKVIKNLLKRKKFSGKFFFHFCPICLKRTTSNELNSSSKNRTLNGVQSCGESFQFCFCVSAQNDKTLKSVSRRQTFAKMPNSGRRPIFGLKSALPGSEPISEMFKLDDLPEMFKLDDLHSQTSVTATEKELSDIPNFSPLFDNNLTPQEYNLNKYHRSNQDTYMIHRPIVHEGQWVERGDILADSSVSVKGEFSIGQNIFVGYIPWEGYNFEDAVLISERLIFDDLYTSLHIERYEVEVRDTQFGLEQITNQIPNEKRNYDYLDTNGIAKIGTWVKEGDILVGKIAPIGQKKLTAYENLLYDILNKEIPKTRDTSLRVPRGVTGRVIHVEILENSKKKLIPSVAFSKSFNFPKKKKQKNILHYFEFYPGRGKKKQKVQSFSLKKKSKKLFSNKVQMGFNKKEKNIAWNTNLRKSKQLKSNFFALKKRNLDPQFSNSALYWGKLTADQEQSFLTRKKLVAKEMYFFKKNEKINRSALQTKIAALENNKISVALHGMQSFSKILKKRLDLLQTAANYCAVREHPKSGFKIQNFFDGNFAWNAKLRPVNTIIRSNKNFYKNGFHEETKPKSEELCIEYKATAQVSNQFAKTKTRISKPMQKTSFSGPQKVHIYLAEKRKLQIGDKIAGRHGNKGIISNILPRQDMPYLSDGTPLDIVLNPLGVPSRMNVGQIFECLLGLAGYYLKQNYKIQPFDEIYGCEASRSLVYSKLYEARIKTGQDWLFNPNHPGKARLFDGRTGECFKQPVTVGVAYILKLIHLVDDKIHARSTGPYSLVTQQPLRGRSKQGGQRVGEMEVWALEGFGAAYILQEILTIKSDDLKGRNQVMNSILNNKPVNFGLPESFKVLVRELQALCLDIAIYRYGENGTPTKININNFW